MKWSPKNNDHLNAYLDNYTQSYTDIKKNNYTGITNKIFAVKTDYNKSLRNRTFSANHRQKQNLCKMVNCLRKRSEPNYTLYTVTLISIVSEVSTNKSCFKKRCMELI